MIFSAQTCSPHQSGDCQWHKPSKSQGKQEPIWLLSIISTIREKFCSQFFARRQLLALKQFPRSTVYSMYPDMLLPRNKVDGNQGAYSWQPKLCDLCSRGSHGTQTHLTMHFQKMSVQLAVCTLRAFSSWRWDVGDPYVTGLFCYLNQHRSTWQIHYLELFWTDRTGFSSVPRSVFRAEYTQLCCIRNAPQSVQRHKLYLFNWIN